MCTSWFQTAEAPDSIVGALVLASLAEHDVLAAGGRHAFAGCWAWIAGIAADWAGYRESVVRFIIAGVGISMATPITSTAVLSAVHHRYMGKASGVSSMLQRFGAAFAIAIARPSSLPTATLAARSALRRVSARRSAGCRPGCDWRRDCSRHRRPARAQGGAGRDRRRRGRLAATT